MWRCTILALAFACTAFPAFSACDDVSGAVAEAAQKRTQKVSDIYNVGMPNPGDFRAGFGDCLDIVLRTGDIFSMGIKLPSLSDILNQACKMASSEVNDAINGALSQAKSEAMQYIQQTGAYKVAGDPTSIAKDTLSGIKGF